MSDILLKEKISQSGSSLHVSLPGHLLKSKRPEESQEVSSDSSRTPFPSLNEPHIAGNILNASPILLAQ